MRIRHHHVGGQGIALRPQPINRPRPHARKARNHAPGEQLILRRRVNHHVPMAGPDHRDIVNTFGRVRKQIGNFDPALPVSLKGPLRPEELSFRGDKLIFRFSKTSRPLLAIQFVEQWLGIVSLDVARPAGHEQEDDSRSLRRHIRRLGSQRIHASGGALQHRAHRQRAKPAESIRQKFPAIASNPNMFRHIISYSSAKTAVLYAFP